MFFRFFKEHKLFFIPHKTITNVLWLPIASSATFMFALPNQLYVIFTAFERWVKVVTSDFLNLTGHAGVEKQFVGLYQAVPQAKMSQSVLYLRENLPFLSFVSKNMALFKKNKPCQHGCKYRVHGTLLNQPVELSMMEKLNFGRNSQFCSRKYPFGRMAENSQ